ncbi:MAG: tRNA 2-thiouridine(34) synthase MnmA [Pseudomonadota bacterium]
MSFNASQSRKQRVVVGISGGVDSSVAAYLLQQAGYDVVGLFMKNWEEDDGTEYCTAIEDLESARKACEILGIELHTANFAAEYWDNVFEDFLDDYRSNRTPNPDVLCNREIKFKQFAKYANLLGGDYIATGHYVGIEHTADGPKVTKAKDSNKDQSYFLQAVSKDKFTRVLFPLGDWLKKDVRKLAQEVGLDNHNRKDSTGICFIGERRFADFLQRYINDAPGQMCDEFGVTISQHRGLHQYTFGQRQGLGIGGLPDRSEAPWYVAGKHAPTNTLLVSQNQNRLCGHWLLCSQVNWLRQPSLPAKIQAKIRYRQTDQACEIFAAPNRRISVKFDEPQRAITPGQFVAFYHAEELLGGARITGMDESRANRITLPIRQQSQ